METKKYKFRTRRGSTTLTDEPFYTGAVKNERILAKKETYRELVKELGGSLADYSAAFIAVAEAVRRTCGRGNCARIVRHRAGHGHGVVVRRHAPQGLQGPPGAA